MPFPAQEMSSNNEPKARAWGLAAKKSPFDNSWAYFIAGG